MSRELAVMVLGIAILLAAVGVATFPCWSYSARWGYAPSMLASSLLVSVAVIALTSKAAPKTVATASIGAPGRLGQIALRSLGRLAARLDQAGGGAAQIVGADLRAHGLDPPIHHHGPGDDAAPQTGAPQAEPVGIDFGLADREGDRRQHV